ncbi:MAG: AraC family transcriptional regulator [Saccharofermentanales bacterium]
MNISERGVLDGSAYYFNTPSSTARSALFYVTFAGEYICSGDYNVERGNFHSYLVMAIRKGCGFIMVNGKAQPVGAGDVVFIDCHRPHRYYTTTGWETQWLHFDGTFSREFNELLDSRMEPVRRIGDTVVVPRLLGMILDGFRRGQPLPEMLMSSHIYRMLTELVLLSAGSGGASEGRVSPALEAAAFIHSNYMHKLSVSGLADYVNISPFHFSREFKKETGYAPYEYITKTRIDRAKELLKGTRKTVQEIAGEVGFKSGSNFVDTFREIVHLTPNEFRHTPI